VHRQGRVHRVRAFVDPLDRLGVGHARTRDAQAYGLAGPQAEVDERPGHRGHQGLVVERLALDHRADRDRRIDVRPLEEPLDRERGNLRELGGWRVDPSSGVDHAERRQQVQLALEALSPPQRRAIELAFFEGLSQSEIAELLQEPLGTIKTRVRLGMQKLRECLRPFYFERGR